MGKRTEIEFLGVIMENLTRNEQILIEEIKVIQDIIKRMASNSFNLKTWTITLIVATILFSNGGKYSIIAYVPLIAFWYLDSYYLKQERLFRKVYNWTVKYRISHDDKLFYFNPMQFNNNVQSTLRIMFTVSTLPFYFGIFIMLSFVIYI